MQENKFNKQPKKNKINKNKPKQKQSKANKPLQLLETQLWHQIL